MNGPHDLGGSQSFVPIAPEPDEPVFHFAWERRAAALSLAMNATGMWNIDMVRYARERIPPANYARSSYYEKWLNGLERLLAEHDLVSGAEFDAKRSLDSAKALPRKPLAADVPAMLAKGSRYDRPAKSPALFAVGDAVRARVMNPIGHTRLPRYVRGRNGTIARVHGVHVFPDSNSAGNGEDPHWLYSVAFDAREVWGPEGRPGDCIYLDLWEPYLSGAEALEKVAPIPRESDGPVFPAPWAARAFAMAVAMHERGVFSWGEWSKTFGPHVAAATADDPGDAEAYWRAWLAALEDILGEKQVAAREALLDLQEAWREAAERTPHGQPIELPENPLP